MEKQFETPAMSKVYRVGLDLRNMEQSTYSYLFCCSTKSVERLERYQENEQRSSSRNSFLRRMTLSAV